MDVFDVFEEETTSTSPAQKPGGRLGALLGQKKREAGSEALQTFKKFRLSKENEAEDRKNEEVVEIKQEKDIKKEECAEEGMEIVPAIRDSVKKTSFDKGRLKGPQIKIHIVEALELCLHEVAIPPEVVYKPLVRPKKLLREYKFILDPFQKEAIMCIENDESVLVSAHTSSGKTVVGEYAITKSLNLKQRVIYTTPIKALSNQKYREFQEEFGDVGLITGDVTINPTAGCLIMTTEILRNMLYRGSEIIREVSWVIFDEIHYMRDKERGVVWEETLILLPDNVHYVFLSATIPNARQFAEWVAHIHNQPCHVVYTDFRPTPLEHYIFPVGGDCLHMVVNDKGEFNDRNFDLAMKLITNPGLVKKTENSQFRGKKNEGKDTSCLKIVRMVMEKNLAPAIVFSFSKKDCEVYAMQIAKLDFNTNEEKKLVDEIFHNAMDVLSEEDKMLPQVENVLPLLRRGIGIHHGGLLPILKETIEVLFSEGLIKALFATETFAMGLNMPAKTVIFTSVKKFDGREMRSITSGEYIQMSGRAGRRGLDDRGTVILMMEEMFSPQTGKDLFLGKADPLNSAFHLSYNMILNLIRVDDINPEYLLDRSFFQFQNHANIPSFQKDLEEVEAKINAISINHEPTLMSYQSLIDKMKELKREYLTFIHNPNNLQQFLRAGRLVNLSIPVKGKDKPIEFGWAMLLNFKQVMPKKGSNSSEPKLTIDVLMNMDPNSTKEQPMPCPEDTKGKMTVISMPHTNIIELSSVVVVLPRDLRGADNMATAANAYKEVQERFKGQPPLLDPVKNMRIKDERFVDLDKMVKNLTKRMEEHKANEIPELKDLMKQLDVKLELVDRKNNLEREIDNCYSLLHMEELKCRKRVLRRLEFCSETDVITLKGRVACEISSADELLLTEMLLAGLFNDLTPHASVALLSSFVCEEKAASNMKIPEELNQPLREIKELAKRILNVSMEAKLEGASQDYLDSVKPFLAEAIIAWCNGVSFLEVCKITDTFEGNIIRCLRRLEELLRQLVQAAKTLGNQDLEIKFNEGIRLIKRDIVFAASLYL
uniref:Superkiller viralicidic activity 2-like 2 n=1 Tax=Lygus hesperus TaxID=30085 RepID=A0A146LDJ4_LYGHE